MCGIFCYVGRNKSQDAVPSGELYSRLVKRGPDYYGVSEEELISASEENDGTTTILTLNSSVLSLRGDHITAQPLGSATCRSRLCWNGEAWKIDGSVVVGNDGEVIYDLLLKASYQDSARTKRTHDDRNSSVLQALNTITGPFAFVFYDEANALLYFGRDCLGRRSLLYKILNDGLLISSVGDESRGWHEVEADGVYCVDPSEMISNESIAEQPISLCPFTTVRFPYVAEESLTTLNRELPSASNPKLDLISPAVKTLESLLRASLQLRVDRIPQPPTLHIPNSNSTHSKIAILFSGGLDCSVLARIIHDLLPTTEPIDLLNVAFHNPRVHGGEASQAAYDACPDRITARSTYTELLRICPNRLFRLIEINVPYTETLSHRTLIKSLIAPHDTEMDLSIASALYFASRGSGHIYEPFSRVGLNDTFYTTPARVLISGLGADELFGGYQRHTLAHQRGGPAALVAELELDLKRLGRRNLGRDDRVLAHWGREARYPFLDEHVVGWAARAPIWEKCGFGEEKSALVGEGEDELGIEPGKKVLRLLAWKLGMRGVAREKKRAIQFGARTAKMETGRTKGSTRIE